MRNAEFVTRKITLGLSRQKLGLQGTLKLGNLYAKRDWGHAQDFVKAYWMMLNYEALKKADETKLEKDVKFHYYVVATQFTMTVKAFLEAAAKKIGFEGVHFEGKDMDEKLLDKDNKVIAELDPAFMRVGNEVPYLQGSYKKLNEVTGWVPDTKIEELIDEMCEYDMKIAARELQD
jgi:GDPmannose 4,6-dehydratase